MNNEWITAVYYGAIASTLLGFVLLLAAVLPGRPNEWGENASSCLPQEILIVGGLYSMAVSSRSTSNQGGNN